MKRFPPPPNASDLNEPSWRHWFYLIADALNGAVDITTSPGVISSSQGTFPMAGMNGEILEGDSHEYIMSPGTSLSFDAAIRFLASSTGMGVTLPLFTATEAGLTPLSGGGTSNFLRADGTWATTGSGSGREILSTDRTYYVRTDGSNSNTGLANTSGGAFLTIQKACDTVCSIDMSTYQVTIQVADGTYTTPVILRSYLGALPPLITGNTGTPANCIISTTSATCITCSSPGVYWTISGIKLTTTTSGNAIFLGDGCKLEYASMDFGAVAGTYSAHIYIDRCAVAVCTGNCNITGGAFAHLWPNYSGGAMISSRTLTITGTPAFSGAFLYSRGGWVQADTTTYSGSATGVRYNLSMNAYAFTNSGTLPGNSAGTTATGGQYA